MKQTTPALAATVRDRVGTRYAKRLRDAGRLPAVIYGHGMDPVPVAVDAREALGHFHKGEKVFRLDLPGASNGSGQMVLLKDLQFDYLGTHIVHADFARVDLNERVRTRVAIHLIGEAVGLKTAGAILMKPNSEVEVECTVAEIPEFIEVRIDALDVGHGITAGDVALPSPTMKVITDHHAMVAQIIIQQEIKVEEAAPVEGAAAAGPEVITAKKEEGAEGEAGAKGAAAKGAAPAKGGEAKGAAPAKPGAPAAKGAAPAAGKAPPKK